MVLLWIVAALVLVAVAIVVVTVIRAAKRLGSWQALDNPDLDIKNPTDAQRRAQTAPRPPATEVAASKPSMLDRWAAEADAERAKQAKIVCPHCQTAGHVTFREVKRKKRVTATRLLGAAVTAGGSLAVTGVSKKGYVNEMSCSNCGVTWDVGGMRSALD